MRYKIEKHFLTEKLAGVFFQDKKYLLFIWKEGSPFFKTMIKGKIVTAKDWQFEGEFDSKKRIYSYIKELCLKEKRK